MRYFLDTEFNERPGLLELISIGIVAEDDREFYRVAVFDEHNCNDWVRQNVLPHLDRKVQCSPDAIRYQLLEFIGQDTPEFWGYYADYDWVVFCWLFGAMVDLPKGWPMYCRDLKQEIDRLHLNLKQTNGARHNALEDARWVAQTYQLIHPAGLPTCEGCGRPHARTHLAQLELCDECRVVLAKAKERT